MTAFALFTSVEQTSGVASLMRSDRINVFASALVRGEHANFLSLQFELVDSW